MLLSIVVPAYNAEKHLRRCIKSAVDIDYSDQYEILIIDDGSIDSTLNICRQLAGEYSNVRWLSTPNSGVSSARNVGINAAKGKYITFLDSDDQYEKNTIENFFRALDKEPDLLYFGYQLFGENGEAGERRIPKAIDKRYKNGFDYLEYELKAKYNINRHAWALCVKREVLKDKDISFDANLTWAEDFDFSMSSFRECKYIVALNKSLYKYIYNPNSAVRTIKLKNIMSEMLVATKWLEVLNESDKYGRLKTYFSEFYCNSISLIDEIIDDKTLAIEYANKHKSNWKFVKGKKYVFACIMWSILGIKNGTKLIHAINKAKKVKK